MSAALIVFEDDVVDVATTTTDVVNAVIDAVDVAAINTEYDDVVVPAVVAFPIDDMDYLVYTSTVVVVDDNATIFSYNCVFT